MHFLSFSGKLAKCCFACSICTRFLSKEASYVAQIFFFFLTLGGCPMQEAVPRRFPAQKEVGHKSSCIEGVWRGFWQNASEGLFLGLEGTLCVV